MDLRCGAPARPGRPRRTSWVASRRSEPSGTNSANLLTDSPPVDCSLATDPTLPHQLRHAKGDSIPARGAKPVGQVVRQPRVQQRGWSHPARSVRRGARRWLELPRHVLCDLQAGVPDRDRLRLQQLRDRELRPGDEHLHVSVRGVVHRAEPNSPA